VKTLTHRAFSSTTSASKNAPLYRLHFLRFGFVSIVETVQMQQAVHDAQAELPRQRVPKPVSMTTRGLRADENFSVLKRHHVRRPNSVKELSMQRRHASIGDEQHEDLAQLC